MKALATFVLRGYSQAMLVVVIGAIVAFLHPLLSFVSLISGAAIALVTLREGWRPGLQLIAGSAVVVGAVGYFTLGGLLPSLTMLGVFWVPLWLVASVLRESRSLSLALTLAGGIGVVAVAVVYLAVGDVTNWWYEQLKVIFAPAITASEQLTDPAMFEAALADLAPLMTGVAAAGMMLNTMICLFLARSWQAQLYNPGGFRDEFHRLQLGRAVAVAGLVLMLLSMLPLGLVTRIADEMLIVLLGLYVIQGLAIVHAIVARRKLHVAWLAALYVVPFLLLPQLVIVIAVFGLIDSWADFRSRVPAKNV